MLEDMIDWRQERVEDMAGDSRDEEEDKASFHTKEEEDCEDTCSMDELLAVVVAVVAVVVALAAAVVAAEAGKCKKVLSEETELLVAVVELLLGEDLVVFDTDPEHSSQCQECSHCSSLLAGSG